MGALPREGDADTATLADSSLDESDDDVLEGSTSMPETDDILEALNAEQRVELRNALGDCLVELRQMLLRIEAMLQPPPAPRGKLKSVGGE